MSVPDLREFCGFHQRPGFAPIEEGLTMQCKWGSIALHSNEPGEGGSDMPGQLTVRLTSELEAGIEALSRRDRRRRSEIVRLALSRFIREETGKGAPSPYDRVKNLLGVVESGVPDLGEAHREHLLRRFRRG
jgi:Arc/MetJ-type ribon-helix-helix transcriptional regulator